MKIKQSLLALTFLTMAGFASATLQQGQDYEILSKPIPQLNPNKIEVLEFFSFTCPHCRDLEPILLKYVQKKLPSDTYFRPEHVIWADSFKSLARITAAANASHTFAQVSPAVYKKMFEAEATAKTREELDTGLKQSQKDLENPDYVRKWVAKQGKWSPAFIKAYNDPASEKAVQNMDNLTTNYNINSTPTIIVGGKYKFIFHNFETDMPRLAELIDMVRKERHMPDPKIVQKIPAIGAKVAHQAMKK